MKPTHAIALTFLCAGLPGLPAAATEKATQETHPVSTAMLSAEPLSTDLLRVQMLGTAAQVEKPKASSTAAQDTPPAMAPRPEKATVAAPAPRTVSPARPATGADAIREAVQSELGESFPLAEKQTAGIRGALAEYYSDASQPLLWVDGHGLSARGKAVAAEIERADDYGLDASDYKLPDMRGFDATASDAIAALASAEIAISQAVLAYARDARGGRITPNRISRNLDPTLALPKPSEVIHSVAFRSDPAAYLRSFQPQHPQFEALRKKLIALRGGETDADGKAPEIRIPDGPLLQLGDADPQVSLLRERLGLAQGADPALYDQTVAEAVKHFQKTHNAAADGVVGPGTRRLLNDPHRRSAGGTADIKKILLNMERWRWLPQDQGRFYVTVNVPEYMLRVVEDDKTIHTTRVVAGATKTPTPVFSADMKSVVFGPFWNVPNSIKTGEIRPYIRPYGGGWYGTRWDTRVLQQHELRIKYNGQDIDPQAIDWSRVDVRKLHFYQPPSPNNVLGRVKFVFPNKHDVYMHDTPQKHFFNRSVRAESHGCMRVQDPDIFAAVLLKHDRNWSTASTRTAFDTAYDKHVPLNDPIPVYVTYFTLWVNDDGSITSYGDIYGHDRRMSAAMFKKGQGYAASDRPVTASPARQAENGPRGSAARFARNTF
ncbi:L,D-transpeptidase family protein [Methyloceanibacter sp.]|uniref:L,D-transpeptidase family protein n=1 Tax=Methyloceanibacter sp. TaxID=1965321 RepID=UPI002D0F05C8|nr:L,D-transpeptidase family protein [Methyloceanibacter sp.]HML93638.1 L,D-transpeptidase family protein [Methyloceanibacter sp.]